MFKWTSGQLIKVYKPENVSDWSGLRWHGNSTEVPVEAPTCGWQGKVCMTHHKNNKIVIFSALVAGTVMMIIVIIVGLSIYRKHAAVKLKEIQAMIIPWDVIECVDQGEYWGRHHISTIQIVLYKDQKAITSHLSPLPLDLEDKTILLDLQKMRGLEHEYVNSFIGICNEPPNVCVLMSYASRGRLYDMIADDDISLTKDFKVSFTLDIVCGMWYLHQSPVEVHGFLRSTKCVIDNRWTCKITGHGVKNLIYQSDNDVVDPTKLFWTAPELLDSIDISTPQAQKGDVYSFAIIAQEIFMKDTPYGANDPELSPQDIIELVQTGCDPPFRPFIPAGTCNDTWLQLIQSCWNQDANKRPSFYDILYSLNHYQTVHLVDSMIKRLDRHAQHLEDKVELRTTELNEEKVKVDILLNEFLPPSVAAKLSAGVNVQPEAFDNVTIFISDIVGFTNISFQSSPLQIVQMLNSVYSMFDYLVRKFDVHKFATIGDAYMVASGVPIINGNKHAAEICHMAVALLKAIHSLPIEHLPTEHLRIRIGIHSGPCVAGVAGIKMPQYLLFGDALDIAARMESRGEAMKIHISETTVLLITETNMFRVEKRGCCHIKGAQNLVTYWLFSP